MAEFQPTDWPFLLEIYLQGIRTGNATFETDPPSWEAWDAGHLAAPRLVARVGAEVVGWAALSRVSDRCAYAGAAENSVYIAETARGAGLGRALLTALVQASEAHGIWTLQTGIFPENTVSIHLHQACGYRVVGVRRRVGQLNGTWRDVVMMERRSEVVGVG